jgi:hypothetical protein
MSKAHSGHPGRSGVGQDQAPIAVHATACQLVNLTRRRERQSVMRAKRVDADIASTLSDPAFPRSRAMVKRDIWLRPRASIKSRAHSGFNSFDMQGPAAACANKVASAGPRPTGAGQLSRC